jgi:hypothetical protein
MATLGAILAIVGAAVYLLSTIIKSDGTSVIGLGSGNPTKYIVGGIISYWPGALLLIVGGILGFGPKRLLGFSAGVCLATGIWALASGVALFPYGFTGFLPWLTVAGSAVATGGGVLLLVASQQARRASQAMTPTIAGAER